MIHSPVKNRRLADMLAAICVAGLLIFTLLPLSPHALADTATSVSVSSATIPKDGQGTTDVFVNGISGPKGLGAYDISINFDRTRVNVVSVSGGAPPFDSAPTSNAGSASVGSDANALGMLAINAFHTRPTGPTGNIKIATVTWKALGEGSQTLNLTIKTLADTNGETMQAQAVSGVITMTPGAPGSPTAPAPTTPAPTAAPITPGTQTPAPTAAPATPGTQTPAPTAAPTTPGAQTPAPTATTQPAPTPAPATPPTGPTPAGTYVEIGSANVAPGGSTLIPVAVKNFTAGSGLGSYDFEVSFDPQGIKVENIKAGDQPFGDPAAATINNSSGKIFFNDFQSSVPGPKGQITVAYLTVTGVAAGSWPITVKVTTLAAANGDDVANVVVNGKITVAGAPVPPTATPRPTTPPPTREPTTPPTKPPAPPTEKPTTATPVRTATPAPPTQAPTTVAPPTAQPTTPAPAPSGGGCARAEAATDGASNRESTFPVIVGNVLLLAVIMAAVFLLVRRKSGSSAK